MQIYNHLHISVIMMDVANPLSLSSVAGIRDDSDDEEVIAAAGGAIAFVSAYHQFQHTSEYKYLDQNGFQWRKKHCGSLFRSSRQKFDYSRAHNAIVLDYLHPNAVNGAEFKLIFRILRTRFEQMMAEVMTRDGLVTGSLSNCHNNVPKLGNFADKLGLTKA